jgi:hypothetical protein
MLELALALVAVSVVGLVALLSTIFSYSLVTVVGLTTLVVGLALAVPTGFWYHVVLYRFVSSRVPVPPTWWLSPSNLHRHLTDAEHRRIRPWYRIGGFGFVLCVAGGLAAIAGLLLGKW